MISRKRVIYSKEFIGEIKKTDFKIVTDEISNEVAENGLIFCLENYAFNFVKFYFCRDFV